MGRWFPPRRQRPTNADGHTSTPSPSTPDFSDLTSVTVQYRDGNRETGEIPLDDLDNFNVPGRDDKGASIAITFHVPPIMARAIDVMVHSKRFPYVNREDFMRHAGLRHLRWLNGIRVTVSPTLMPQLEVVMEAIRDAEFRLAMERAFKDLDRLVEMYMRQGERSEAVRLISLIMANMQDVEQSAGQREFVKGCLRRYSRVMAGVEGWEEEVGAVA